MQIDSKAEGIFVLGSLRKKYLTRSQVLRSEVYLYAVIILGGLRKKYLTRFQILRSKGYLSTV